MAKVDGKSDENIEEKVKDKPGESTKVMFMANVKYAENVLKKGDTLVIDKSEAEEFEELGIAKIVE